MKTYASKMALLISCIGLASCGSADDENSFSGAMNKGFEEGWATEFVDSCVAEAVKVGAPQSDATTACECVSGELVGKLDGISEKINPPKDKMNAALKACGIPAG
ncbi:MAG: hypothetical protein ABJN65_14450 [Parasphingorhabdus sp.]